MDCVRNYEKCIAVRLQPTLKLLQASGKGGITESTIRQAAMNLYGKKYHGQQFFLSGDSTSPKPIRNRQYNNTKPAKAIFINMDDLTEPTRAALKAGKLFAVYDNWLT